MATVPPTMDDLAKLLQKQCKISKNLRNFRNLNKNAKPKEFEQTSNLNKLDKIVE